MQSSAWATMCWTIEVPQLHTTGQSPRCQKNIQQGPPLSPLSKDVRDMTGHSECFGVTIVVLAGKMGKQCFQLGAFVLGQSSIGKIIAAINAIDRK